jgi:probable phosphoglycerate mutase
MKTTRICLVRHGETEWNAEKRIQGQVDIALNAQGLAQAEAVARWLSPLPVAALYSSDLLRAWQTAEPTGIAQGLTPIAEHGLRERRYGIFEGLTYAEARSAYPACYELFEHRDPDAVIPQGGESLRQLDQRVTECLRRLAARHAGQMIVLVTHGGVLDIVNRFVRGNALELPRDFLIPNAGITWLTLTGNTWALEAWGETRHLEMGAAGEAHALDEIDGSG